MKTNLRQCFVLISLILTLHSTALLASDPAHKFSRGLHNTAFGWFEIPNEIGLEADRHGPLLGFASGLMRGIVFGAGRTLAGIYEIVTFPIPNGAKKYEAFVYPESVFDRR